MQASNEVMCAIQWSSDAASFGQQNFNASIFVYKIMMIS